MYVQDLLFKLCNKLFVHNISKESSPESSSSCASGGVTSCHSQASCVDYNPGFCCQCRRHGNFFGNGRVCLQEGNVNLKSILHKFKCVKLVK